MGMIWYPGQDVDFMERLAKIERLFASINQGTLGTSTEPYSVGELEAENKELRTRVDDLEELVITLSEEVGQLGDRVGPKSSRLSV